MGERSAPRATVRVGTRGSALALAQSRMVAAMLEEAERGLAVELVAIRTSGDERAGGSGSTPGSADDKSRFVKEIEEALLAGEVDLAVHSAKDVPGVLPDGLAIVGVPERADARDAVVVPGDAGELGALPAGARVGTSSLRRRAQLLATRPDLDVVELRGNVDTRLRRLEEGRCDALVLASAGLERLGRDPGAPLEVDVMTPAPGQGCLLLEARSDDEAARALAALVTDRASLVRLTAERALVARLDATCRTPLAAYAELDGDGGLVLSAFAGVPDGSTWVRDTVEGSANEPSALGLEVAERLLAAGAADVLAAAEAAAA